MTTPKNKGLTIQQINKAANTNAAPKPVKKVNSQPLFSEAKPSKIHRKNQHIDTSLLLDVIYSTGQICSQLPTPEWFNYKDKPDVSIIIPLYMSDISEMVDSWDFSYDGLRAEIIFVDDNCPWNSGEKIVKAWENRKKEAPKGIGKVFVSPATQGYGACCNFGAEIASGKILIFLHPESKIFPGTIGSLVKLARQPQVGAVGGLHVFEQDDTVLESGMEWNWDQKQFLSIGCQVYKNQKLHKPFEMNNVPIDIFQSGEREAISSNLMAVKRNEFLEIGGFNPTIFHQTWSDADFCCAVREKKLKVFYQQSARSYHKIIKPIDKFFKNGEAAFINKWITTGRIDSIVKDVRKETFADVHNILIRRQMAHGDVLVAAAIAPALKKKYPKAKIVFATDCPEVVQKNPWIDQVVSEYSERQFNIFINLDMAYEYRPKANFLTAYADVAGVSVKDCKLFLHTEMIDDELPEKYVVMHAGNTFWAGRGWSTIKFDQICSRLRSEGYKIVCVGTPSDHKPIGSDIDLRGKTNIFQLADVIKKSCFFVGTDSFPMVIAETFNVRGVSFFGSILPQTRLITGSIVPVSAKALPCIGCHHRKALPCVATASCELGVQECVTGISVETMWSVIQKNLELSTNTSK